jgi:hypothetical protein
VGASAGTLQRLAPLKWALLGAGVNIELSRPLSNAIRFINEPMTHLRLPVGLRRNTF